MYNMPPHQNFRSNYRRAPFDVPKMRSPLGSAKKAGLLGAAKKMNLSSMINTTSKTINTFNQMVPLYREIKPVFENGKVLVDTFKRAFIKKKTKTNPTNKPNEVVEPEILNEASVKVKTKEKKETEQEETIKVDDGPHKPFF